MPNHITNYVRISGEDHEEVFNALVGEDGEEVNFEGLMPMPEDVERGDLTAELQAKTAGRNWYDWSIANWGTKWNAYNGYGYIHGEEGAILKFDTAWSPPRPILKHILDNFDVEVTWHYVDEGDYILRELEASDVQ